MKFEENKLYNIILRVRLSPSKKFGFICFNGSSLKMMSNAYYFILKILFVLTVSTVNFKIYDVTNWKTNNYKKHVASYLKN